MTIVSFFYIKKEAKLNNGSFSRKTRGGMFVSLSLKKNYIYIYIYMDHLTDNKKKEKEKGEDSALRLLGLRDTSLSPIVSCKYVHACTV